MRQLTFHLSETSYRSLTSRREVFRNLAFLTLIIRASPMHSRVLSITGIRRRRRRQTTPTRLSRQARRRLRFQPTRLRHHRSPFLSTSSHLPKTSAPGSTRSCITRRSQSACRFCPKLPMLVRIRLASPSPPTMKSGQIGSLWSFSAIG